MRHMVSRSNNVMSNSIASPAQKESALTYSGVKKIDGPEDLIMVHIADLMLVLWIY